MNKTEKVNLKYAEYAEQAVHGEYTVGEADELSHAQNASVETAAFLFSLQRSRE